MRRLILRAAPASLVLAAAVLPLTPALGACPAGTPGDDDMECTGTDADGVRRWPAATT